MYHLKELLGHTSLDTLKHYARLTITDLRKTHAKCHPMERDDCKEDNNCLAGKDDIYESNISNYKTGFDMSVLLYLDYNCFQRSFDDQRQARIRLEAIACEEIFSRAEDGRVDLAWSFIHEDENIVCPYLDRKSEVLKLSELCKVKIGPDPKIKDLAVEIQKSKKLAAKDALHVACAIHSRADIFLTCDDSLQRKAGAKCGYLVILNPTEYVLMEK